MDPKKSSLDPCRILLGYVLDLEISSIQRIIDKSGMNIDWYCDEEDYWDEKDKIPIFRQRIITAYNSLPADDQLRVLHVIAGELSKYRLKVDTINENLGKIGWSIEKDRLVPVDAEVKQLFFPVRTQHDAYVEIRKIVQKASASICIIDNHIDGTLFTVLSTIPQSPIEIKLLTCRTHGSDFSHEVSRFMTQHSDFSVEIRKTTEFHDRFIVIDETECWHIGASIKDAGNKAFMISLIEDDGNSTALINQLENSWNDAQKHNK